MDFDALPIDDESFRAHQSECIDMTLIHLGHKLREMGISFDDAELAEVPTVIAQSVLQYLEAFHEREAEDFAAVKELSEKTAQFTQRFETLRGATERVKGEAAVMSERITAAMKEYLMEKKLEAERRRERQREIRDISRQSEKKDMELRKENLELERLNKLLKNPRH